MDRYDQIRDLISNYSDIVSFADFGDGVPDEWIQNAEAALRVRLPGSFKWWLRNYGGGEVGGEEIYSLYSEVPGSVLGGDIVHMHRQNQIHQRLPPNQIAIVHSDIDGLFHFDTSVTSLDNEYPIMSAATGQVYAVDFFKFLRKRIEAFST